jgi:glutamyl-tRNA reductase
MVLEESQMIGQVAAVYSAAQSARRAGPAITALVVDIAVPRDVEPEASVNDASLAHVEWLAQALANKLLHEPATQLPAEAGNSHARDYAEAMRYLFDLAEKDPRSGGRS